MTPKKTYPFNGQQVPGEVVSIEESTEPWAQYTLADGTSVKVKAVMIEAVRLDAYNDTTGDPIYLFQFQQIVGAVSPEALKRKVH